MTAAVPPLPNAPVVRMRLSSGRRGTAETIAIMARLAMGPWGAQSTRIRDLAVGIVRAAGVAAKDYRGEVEAIHRWVQRAIRYTRDPVGQERVQTPEHTAFVARAGDCDDFAALEATLLGALGHSTRFITIGFSPVSFSHVYLEVNVRGQWIPLDPIKPDKPAGWQASGAAIRRAWPVNRAGGFDPYTARLAGLGDGIYGPLPDPQAWRQERGDNFPIGPTVPGWNGATKEQRKVWLKAMQAIARDDGAAAEQRVAFWDGAERVTLGVATLGLSEVERKWNEAKVSLNGYRTLRAEALALADRRPDLAPQLRTEVARQDAAILAKLGPLRPWLAAEAGLGILPQAVAALGGPVVIALLIALIAVIGYAVSSLANLLRSFGAGAEGAGRGLAATATSLGGPLLTLALIGAVVWWWRHRRQATGA